MSIVDRLVRFLARPDVLESAIATGRFPAVRLADGWRAISDTALSADDIVEELARCGGAAKIAALSDAPTQWVFRVEGLGNVEVTATRRGPEVRARFVVVRGAAREAPREIPREAPKPAAAPQGESFEIERTAHTAARPAAAPARVEAPVARVEAPVARVEAPVARAEAPVARPVARSASRGGDRLDELLAMTRAASATDLHVVAGRPPMIRIAGELVARGEPIDAEDVERLLLPRVPERLRDDLARDGSCDFALDFGDEGRARVNVARQRTGLFGCFRMIPREVPSVAGLALPPDITKATHHHQGLIVVTGPTGHGKTTTLAALVDVINTESTHHLITVEDPVEYVHPRKRAMLSQREVGTHTKSFRNALKAALREDPDVIVVGELRDRETVAMALSASETGHLVLGTMNTPSAAKTIDRLVDMFPPGDQQQVRLTLAGGLKLVVGQRLVPSADRKRVHAAVELLPGSIALWNLIREEKTYQIPSLQQRGRALGIVRLDDSLAELVRAGKIAASDALAVAESPDTLNALLRGPAAAAAQAPPAAGGGPGLLERAGNIFGRKGS